MVTCSEKATSTGEIFLRTFCSDDSTANEENGPCVLASRLRTDFCNVFLPCWPEVRATWFPWAAVLGLH
ncbi:uncharacterized protein LOC142563915 isoform X7 [Dermacentor variabilis]|uniref:uncharacterized protein LOC142563915 isoform X7 n=1 Tax=Dermacentor variabilis TaxID=34621 RepID=UPI003F5BD11D